jgi:hypothetical protein
MPVIQPDGSVLGPCLTVPIVPWPGWEGETCIRRPATTPREAVAAVRAAYDVDAEHWLVTPHLGGWVVALADTPIAAGGGVWHVADNGNVEAFNPLYDGFPDTMHTYRVRRPA